MILGSFFWGYICTEIPGGRLAEIIGTRRVFGYSMLISSLITLLIPLMATFGYVMIVILRVILGFMLVRRHFPIMAVVSLNIIQSVSRHDRMTRAILIDLDLSSVSLSHSFRARIINTITLAGQASRMILHDRIIQSRLMMSDKKSMHSANQGTTWPAIQPMTARWIPPTERSKFVSNMMGK
jgi:MFS family permease